MDAKTVGFVYDTESKFPAPKKCVLANSKEPCHAKFCGICGYCYNHCVGHLGVSDHMCIANNVPAPRIVGGC